MRHYDVMVCVSMITEIIFVLRTPVHAQSGYTCCVLINLHLHLCTMDTELNCVIPRFRKPWECVIFHVALHHFGDKGYKTTNWVGSKSAYGERKSV